MYLGRPIGNHVDRARERSIEMPAEIFFPGNKEESFVASPAR